MSIAVRRVGNLNQYSIVLCRTEQGTATAGSGSRPGEQDYVEYAGQVGGDTGTGRPDHTCHQARRKEWVKSDKNTKEGVFVKSCGLFAVRRGSDSGQGEAGRTGSSRPQSRDSSRIGAFQVQFEEREDTKACTIAINDDDVFEGTESFSVELSMPAYALLGNVTRATVTIADPEDEPTLQFDRSTFHVSESAGFLSAPVERKGGSGRAGRRAEPHGRDTCRGGALMAEREPLGFACLWFWGVL